MGSTGEGSEGWLSHCHCGVSPRCAARWRRIIKVAGATRQDTRLGRHLVPQHDGGHPGWDSLSLRGYAGSGGRVLEAPVRSSLVLVGPRHPPTGPSSPATNSESNTLNQEAGGHWEDSWIHEETRMFLICPGGPY